MKHFWVGFEKQADDAPAPFFTDDNKANLRKWTQKVNMGGEYGDTTETNYGYGLPDSRQGADTYTARS